MIRKLNITKQTGVALAVLTFFTIGAKAQQQPKEDSALERVEVTALKIKQSLQDVAASLSVLTADDLARSGIVSALDLQQKVPGLSLSSGGREENLAIRGVSNNVRSLGADPSNAVHLDGVYLPRSSMVLTELFDLQRVEVLKGPEGTLYGRNATGGAINFITRAANPGDSAEGFVGGGSQNLGRAQLAVGWGKEDVSGRVAVAYSKDSGFTRNIANNTNLDVTDFSAIRGKLRFALGQAADVTILVQSSDDQGTVGYGVSTDPAVTGPLYPYSIGDPDYKLTAKDQRSDPRNIRLDSPVTSSRKTQIVAATVNWDLGNVGFKSITASTKFDASDKNDVDWTSSQLETQDTSTTVDSLSQEFQLYSQGSGPLEWTAGLFFYKDNGTENLRWKLYGPLNCGFAGACDFVSQSVKSDGNSSAIFGQATYHFTPQWAALLGGRYTVDEKNGNASNLLNLKSFSGAVAFNSFTPKTQLQWTPSKDLLVYAGVSRGFKSGGWNYGAGGIEKFAPETLVAYEVGARSKLMNGAVNLNASIFNYDYRDLQLRTAILDAVSGKFQVNVNNASSAKVQGFELNADARLGLGFTLGLAASYVDSRLENYISPTSKKDLSGLQLPLTPKNSGTISLDYDTALSGGSLRSRLEFNGRSSVIFPLTLDQKNNSDEGYGIVNASVRWAAPNDSYFVQLGVLNATDKLYRTMRADYLFGGVVESYGAPRTFEVRLGFKY